jgi:hypothetical protein
MIEFLASPAGLAMKAALAAAFLDFATGVWRAYQDQRLALDAIGAMIRKHLLGRVLPLSLLAWVAYVTKDPAMLAAAAAALTLYGTETTASIYAALKVPGSSRVPID